MSTLEFIKTKYFLRQLIIALSGLVIIAFLAFSSLGLITHHNQKIVVPDLSKKPLYEVEKILEDIDLNMVVRDSAEYNPDFPKNSVIKQSPRAGDVVKSNRKIYLTINASGYRIVTIPEFYGKTKRNVESTLKAIGFSISSKYEYIPDIGKDVVRGIKYNGKNLKVGDKLPKKSLITLVLGEGGVEEIIGYDSILEEPSLDE